MAAASISVETYREPPRGNEGPLKSEDIVFATSGGAVGRILVTGQGAVLADFAVIPHLEHADRPALPGRPRRPGAAADACHFIH